MVRAAADQMPQGVIQRFEAVHVDENQRELELEALAISEVELRFAGLHKKDEGAVRRR